MRRRRELEDRLREAERLLDRIDRNVEGIERVTMVREPGNHKAAEAYDGLRRQIGAALAERHAHLHQLAQFDAARRANATPEQLESLVSEWMGQAQLAVVFAPDVPGAFEEVGDSKGDHIHVLTPAYVDEVTGRVVRSGFVERTSRPPLPPSLPSLPPEMPSTSETVPDGGSTDSEAMETVDTDPNGASA